MNMLTQEEASNRVAVGMILLLAQRFIAADERYPATDIKKFLRMRKKYHPYFTEGAGALAEMIDSGEIEGPPSIVPALRRLEKSSPNQFTQMMTQVARAARGLQRTRFENRYMRLFMRLVSDVLPDENEDLYRRHFTDLMGMAVRRFDPPGPIKTLFRRYRKAPSGLSVEALRVEYVEPGAWFDMTSEEKADLQRRLEKVGKSYEEFDYSAASEGERRAFFDSFYRQRAQIIAEAGVNQNIIARGDVEPLETVLRREKNLNPDGPTSFVLERAVKRLTEAMEYARERGQKVNPYRKGLTLLRKAKSFESVIRVLQTLQDSKLIYEDEIKAVREDIERVKLNKAVQSGKPLVPITFEPMTESEFQEEFDAGEIQFAEGYSEEEKQELLGRVGRSVRDLEMIFGKGFCGKGPKKLRFTFEGGEGAGLGALASYFAWERRDGWDPRVKFGRDFEGLLAHELSHYIEEIIDWRFKEVTDQTRSEDGYQFSPGNIFGRTGVDTSYFVTTIDKRMEREDSIFSQFPELAEFIRAVHATPDYRRWEDKIGSALEMTLDGAIQKVTGISAWDHPDYKGWRDTKFYKSDFPTEIIEQASRDYKAMMSGDGRKLTYYHSVTEVWARMLEQYVYTRLAEIGISNPWLTQVTYDLSVMDQFMEQDRFEKEIAPILDRLFDRLKKRELIARVAAGKEAAFRLRAKDKKVIEAFTREEPLDGKLLTTDGKSLHKHGMGGEKVAVWRGPKIAVVSTESAKSDEVIIRYLVKVAGKRMVTFSYERGGHDVAIQFEAFSDVVDRYQTRTVIVATAPNGDRMGSLTYDYFPYNDGKGNHSITMIEVDPEYRRSNVATELYREMFRREGISKRDLRPGYRTEDGDKFRSRALLASDNVPTNPKLWDKVQKLTRGEVKSIKHDGKTIEGPNDGKGFEIFPSAYSNGWAAKVYKDLGGGWKTEKKSRVQMAREVAERYASSYLVMRPEGWEATSDEAYKALDQWKRSGHVYRGMDSREYQATVGRGKPVWSTGNWSHESEGTNFADHPGDAESYVNFGRTDPRKTGKPTYLVEVKRTPSMEKWPDGYIKSPDPVPYSEVKRVWEMYPENGEIRVRTLKTASKGRGKAKKDVGKGGLDEWFSGHDGDKGDATWGDWVAITPVKKKVDDKTYEPGDIVGPCGISKEEPWKEVTNNGKDPLKCMPRDKAHDLSKKERAELAKNKQRAEKKDKNTGKKPTRTPTVGDKAKEVMKKAFSSPPNEFRDHWESSKYRDFAYVGLSSWVGEGYVLDPAKGRGEYGIYVTPFRRYAKAYGSKVHECFVSIRKPLVVEGKYEIAPRDLVKSDIDELKSQGYDSIVVTSSTIDRASEFVLFDRKQVWVVKGGGKKASGNDLYHATPATRVDEIMSKGLRSDGPSQRGAPAQAGVSTTTKFSVVSRGDFGNVVLVLDRNKLRGFDLVDTDYWGDGSEAEIRVVDPKKDVTVIPPSAIKELIFLTPKLMKSEIRWISKHGKPISTYWKGEKVKVVAKVSELRDEHKTRKAYLEDEYDNRRRLAMARRIASVTVIARADMQALSYAQAWLSKHSKPIQRRLEVYISPTGHEAKVNILEPFRGKPLVDSLVAHLESKGISTTVHQKAEPPMGWHVAKPVYYENANA